MIRFESFSEARTGGPSAVTIGKFDGLHRGHGRLLKELGEEKKKGLYTVLISLKPLDPEGRPRTQIFTDEELSDILSGKRVDCLITVPMDADFLNMDAESFMREILIGRLQMKSLICGEDFCFGKDRAGDSAYLSEAGKRYGFRLSLFPVLRLGGRKISSSDVRGLLAEGRVGEAARLLGRSYSVRGTVIHGKQLGRTLGFPTLNVSPDGEKLYPVSGVYGVRVRIRGRWYTGMANLGPKPTVSEETENYLEVHVFDFSGDVYGQRVQVLFRFFVRPSVKFASVSALGAQLAEDKRYICERMKG